MNRNEWPSSTYSVCQAAKYAKLPLLPVVGASSVYNTSWAKLIEIFAARWPCTSRVYVDHFTLGLIVRCRQWPNNAVNVPVEMFIADVSEAYVESGVCEPAVRRSNDCPEIYLGANHGILTPKFFWTEIFSGAQVSWFSAKSLKFLPPAVRF